MKKIISLENNDWLDAINWQNELCPLRISNFLPKFDNYFGIIWKVGILENFPFQDFIEDAKSESEIKNNKLIWRNFPQVFDNSENEFKEISAEKIFEKFKIPYHDYKNDNKLPWNTRAIRTLESQIVKSLTELLIKIPENDKLTLYWEDYYRFNLEDKLFKVSKEEYLKEMRNTGFDASTYLYPESKNWCLLNLEDLGFNILAFNNNIKDQMNFLSKIENFKMSEQSELFRY